MFKKVVVTPIKSNQSNYLMLIDQLTKSRSVSGFGDSESCQVNVNCSPEGDNWQDVKRAVCRISIKIGNNSIGVVDHLLIILNKIVSHTS